MPAVARIENIDLSPHTVASTVKDGTATGEPIVIPAGKRESPSVVRPGTFEVATKADLERLQKQLGKGLSDDGSTKLRLVRLA